jgi:peptidoglycan/LPS O-acetylase OafA/YrhL
MNVTQRYATLDGLRGVAAFFVVCYHTHIFRGSSAIAPHGYLAVDFFFLLSGFVIASAYEKKIVAGFTVTEFFKHRVIRLYPIALAGVLLGALRLLAHYTINPFESEPAPWIALAILLNVLILPLWSQTHFRGELFPANGPVWSLFGEFLVNLGWSVLASLKLPFTVIALLLAASGIKLFSLMHHVALDDLGWSSQHLLGAACRVTFSFLLGTAIYRFRGALPNLSNKPGMLPVITMIALLLVLGMPWFGTVWDAMAIFSFLPAILMLGVICGRESSAPVRALLGEMSYPVYAIHFPIFLLVSEFRHLIFPSLDVSSLISISVLLALVAAFALNRFDHWLRARPEHPIAGLASEPYAAAVFSAPGEHHDHAARSHHRPDHSAAAVARP